MDSLMDGRDHGEGRNFDVDVERHARLHALGYSPYA